MRTYSLYSHEQDMPVKWFDKFDKVEIKNSIIQHLTDHPKDTIELCREYSKKDLKRYYGNEILQIFEVNPKNNKPSICITRGNKMYYKTLTVWKHLKEGLK